MNILLLGGTGAMGTHIAQLLSQNKTVHVTTRQSRLPKDNIVYLQGNARELTFLHSILSLKSWDVIIDFMVYTTLEFQDRSNLLLTSTKQYIFLSSARVYAESKKPLTEESTRLLDASTDQVFLETDEYSLTKARQENTLKESSFSNWTIIRPYITFSDIRLQLGVLEKEDWLYRALKGRTIVFSSDIAAKLTTMTYGRDVAKGIISIIHQPMAHGKTYHIAHKQSKTWNEILQIYLKVLEKHLGYRPKVLLTGLDDFSKIHQGKYQVYYDRLFDRKFDSSEINNFIEVNSFEELETSLANCLDIFLQNPNFNEINWKSEAIKDKIAHDFTSLGEIRKVKQKLKYLYYRFIKKG